jgi:nucleotide-binding universal stress UspA family protein
VFRDIAVYLTGSDEDRSRIDHAVALAVACEARLTALHLHELPEMLAPTDYLGAGYLQTMITESQERAEQVHRDLVRQLSDLPVAHNLRRLESYPGQTGDALAAEVRTSDLFVGTLPYATRDRRGHIEEAVLFKSGRGCLFVPPGAAARGSYETIFVAWKNNREAARAVAEALPFLHLAAHVSVGIVDEGGGQFGEGTGTDIIRYLDRHGVDAELRAITGSNNVGEALLQEAGQSGAQLIVMGGYGHSRFREWVLGGVTRHMLTNAKVPVLTAH